MLPIAISLKQSLFLLLEPSFFICAYVFTLVKNVFSTSDFHTLLPLSIYLQEKPLRGKV